MYNRRPRRTIWRLDTFGQATVRRTESPHESVPGSPVRRRLTASTVRSHQRGGAVDHAAARSRRGRRQECRTSTSRQQPYLSHPLLQRDPTVRQLLSHTSGIPDDVQDQALSDAIIADPTRFCTPEARWPTATGTSRPESIPGQTRRERRGPDSLPRPTPPPHSRKPPHPCRASATDSLSENPMTSTDNRVPPRATGQAPGGCWD